MAQLGRLYKYMLRSNGNAVQGVDLTVYREGATVNGAQSGTSPFTVTVRHNGKIKTGDTVFVGTDSTTVYNTNGGVGTTTIVLGGFTGTLNLADGDRIVPRDSKPTLYSDDQGGATKTNPLTSSSTGLCECFTEFGAYDMLQSGGGLSTLLHVGQVVGSEAPGQIRYADDFAANSVTGGIQEAIDDLPSAGGRVICSGKTYSTTTAIWLHSGVHLQGAGVGDTVIQRSSNSITNSGAANSGAVVATGPKGSNGTLFSSGTSGSDISITNLTLDGNQSTQTGTTATLGPVGAHLKWVTGLFINNVKIINTLQTGYYITNCADIHLNNFSADTVGQWSTVSDRNAISLHNADNSTTNTNSGSISNFYFKTVGDEAITLSGVRNLAVSNGAVDGCDFGIEFTAASTVSIQDCSFSNINFRNGIDFGITFNATVADVARINFTNLNFGFHSTLHNAGVIYMSSSTSNMSDIIYSNITASNINSLDTTSRNWIDCQAGTAGKTRSRLFFTNLNFQGLSTSTRTGDVGAVLLGPCVDIFFTGCVLKDVAGLGFAVDDSAADTQANIHFNNCVVDGANYNGFQLRNNGFAATIKEVYYNNCVARNIGKQAVGNDSGWVFNAGFAGSTINHIYLRGCRSYKTTGATHLYGANFTQTAGTLDNITVTDCDFSGTQTAWFLSSGTVTNVKFTPPSDRGTDILSAATIAIPPDGTSFHVTAANNITNGITVNSWDNGRLVTLIFDSTPTVSDTGTSVLAGNFIATADDTLTLRCDGTNWYEVSRSAN